MPFVVAVAFVVFSAGSIAVEIDCISLTWTAFNVPTMLPVSVVTVTGTPPIDAEIVNVVLSMISKT